MQSTENNEVDTNLYSRQIGTYGMETMGKLIKMNVLIVGMRGLGVEVAKNLILAGPRSVTIVDDEITKINDLGANFYLEESHVGQVSRANASYQKLQELNPYVKVGVMDSTSKIEEAIKSGQFHVVCHTEMIINGNVLEPKDMNALCRQHNVGYISAQALGHWGYTFLDYGTNHTITDANGEACKEFIVIMIERGETTKVTLHEDKRHTYEEGDYVKFREVEGMVEINNTEPILIEACTATTLTLKLDSRNFGEYQR
jgi:ubiquitin-activating enzyme E1